MALDLKNEYKYLDDLIKKGSAGEAAWAKQQMDTYIKQYGGLDPSSTFYKKATLQEPRLDPIGGAAVSQPTKQTPTTPSAISPSAPIAVTAPQNDPYLDMADYIRGEQEKLKQAAIDSKIAGLSRARQNAEEGLQSSLQSTMSAYKGEEAAIGPAYYDKRNQAAAASDVGAMNFAQYMASRGIKGSAGGMPEIYRQAGLQGQIGALDRQETADISDIERRRSAAQAEYDSKMAGIGSAFESDVANAKAGIDAETMQNYINAMTNVMFQQAAQKAADQAAMGLTSTGQQTIIGRQAQDAETERQAALIAQANYSDIQAEINRRADIDPNDPIIPYLQAARQQKIKDQEALEYERGRDTAADTQWQQKMDLDLRRQTFAEAQQDIENAYRNAQISLAERDQALQWAKHEADQNPESIDNLLKKAQIDATAQGKTDTNLNNIIQRLDSIYLHKDPITGEIQRNPNFTDQQVRAAIIGLGLPDDNTDALLLRYGLSINQ